MDTPRTDAPHPDAKGGFQPSNDELHHAWTAAMTCIDIPGARAETMQHLIDLMRKRTTWFGLYENGLRIALNGWLNEQGQKV